jgi:hypothetical protein
MPMFSRYRELRTCNYSGQGPRELVCRRMKTIGGLNVIENLSLQIPQCEKNCTRNPADPPPKIDQVLPEFKDNHHLVSILFESVPP